VLQISRLNDDFLSESGIYVRAVDEVRSASVFKHKGIFYVNSGCTDGPHTIRFFRQIDARHVERASVGVSETEEQKVPRSIPNPLVCSCSLEDRPPFTSRSLDRHDLEKLLMFGCQST